MNQEIHSSTTAGSRYATAHEAHYKSKDLRQALDLYQAILVSHPESREAGYSRTQIQNIAKEVIPPAELLAAESGWARSHLESATQPQAQRRQNEAGR